MKENVGGKSFEEECPGGGGSASRLVQTADVHDASRCARSETR
jgi:hypothetical protein